MYNTTYHQFEVCKAQKHSAILIFSNSPPEQDNEDVLSSHRNHQLNKLGIANVQLPNLFLRLLQQPIKKINKFEKIQFTILNNINLHTLILL